jgi:hypothetical protein
MSLTVIHPQWRDQRRRDRGPFSDRIEVPDGLAEIIVDAALYVYRQVGPLWLGSLTVVDDLATVEVTDGTATAAGECRRDSGDEIIRLRDATGRPAGVLVGARAGFPELFARQGGPHRYTRAQTEFAAGVVLPLPSLGVLSLSAGGDPLAGEAVLVGERGVKLSRAGDGVVVVDIDGVSPLAGEGRKGLRTISLAGPDPRGDFKFVGSLDTASDSALRIRTGGNSVTFSVIGD